MKNIITIFILFVSLSGIAQIVIDFEGTPPVFNDFNGSSTQVIANPDPSGINTSANVAENTVPANAAFAGVNTPISFDITTQKLFRMDVWSPIANTPVLLKLENSVTGVNTELQATTGAANQWHELVFDFSFEPALTFDSLTIFMNFNVIDPNTQVYYWDNLEQFTGPTTLPLTFEGAPPIFNDFNGSTTQVIANPDPSGINTSANVAENTVPANAAFAGVNIPISFDIATQKLFRMDVWSPIANTPVLLKLENSVTGVNTELQATTGAENQWHELVFDFSFEPALTFDSLTVFMNFNVIDPNTQVYYWDNLEQFAGPTTLPLTFEGTPPVFNDFNGSFTQVIANPDPSGINTSANVAENTVPANAAFAGVNIAVDFDIATQKLFLMDVWSPIADTPVLLKLENSVTGVNTELQATTGAANQWHELVFDFSFEPALDFDSLTVFMNFNVIDPNTQVYYWDNLEQFAGPTTLPLTFEGTPPVFNDFNGSFTQVIANPDPSGINTSAIVAENTVPANAAFAGVNIAVDFDIATQKLFRMDVWSPIADTPVLLKLENSVTGVNTELQATTGAANQWHELVFDFSFEPALDFDSLTVFMNFNVIDPNTQVYYWDNLEQFAGPTTLPLTFEGTPPVFNDFNGSFTQVIANPDPSGINTSANVAENTVPANAAFAGVNITVDFDIATQKLFRMDVWSPIADTPVLLKLENSVTGVNTELQATTGAANQWHELVFDFSSEPALDFDSLTVFMNFNVIDPNTQVYYWDNLEQFAGPTTLPITFEGIPPVFNDFNGSFTQVIANPDPSGINTSDNVAENTVPANAAFAGVNIAVDFDIATDKYFRMDVWSPIADTPVLLKLENSVTGVNTEIQATTGAANQWHELVFDFSFEPALSFDSLTVFMNFNVIDPNTQVYYWDNLEQFDVITYDDCLGALPISCGDVVQGDTLTATDDNVPDCDPGVPNAPGVWYKWEDTTGLAANVSFSTCSANTDYDTQLTVYTGSCADLVCVANNDDDPNCTNFQSTVEFATDGSATTYYILVQGWNGNTGNFELTMTCDLIPPPNDDIEDAIDLDEVGCPFTDEDVAMPAATFEDGTPTDCDITGANGVWYKFTPELNGQITGTIITPGGVQGAYLSVNNGPLAGNYASVAADFGAPIPADPLTSDSAVVIDDDTTGDPNDACDPIDNGGDLSGKIAVLRRGACEFGFKALAAQNEGAVAVIVVNNQPGEPIVMGGGAVGGDVTIPVVMVSDVDGEAIITEILGGNTVNMTLVSGFDGFSSITFYTAPDESSSEDELVLVDWFQNQCLPSASATIPVTAGQAYYCFVVNTGSVTDIVFDNCQLGVDSNEIEGFVFYPNPTNDILNLSATQNIEKVALYNLLGQRVIDMNVGATQTQIGVSNLAIGAYIMEVMVDGQRGIYKVIKN